MGIDKIPLEKFKEGEDGSFAWLDKNGSPIMIIRKDEYANGEKINQIIEELRDTQERVTRLEGK